MAELTQGQHVGAKNDVESRSKPPGTGGSVVALPGGPGGTPKSTPSSARFETQLEDAEELIKYAAAAGIDVEEDIRRDVVAARLVHSAGFTQDAIATLLSALTKLSITMKPVSGESLRRCVVKKEALQMMRNLRSIFLAIKTSIDNKYRGGNFQRRGGNII